MYFHVKIHGKRITLITISLFINAFGKINYISKVEHTPSWWWKVAVMPLHLIIEQSSDAVISEYSSAWLSKCQLGTTYDLT